MADSGDGSIFSSHEAVATADGHPRTDHDGEQRTPQGGTAIEAGRRQLLLVILVARRVGRRRRVAVRRDSIAEQNEGVVRPEELDVDQAIAEILGDELVDLVLAVRGQGEGVEQDLPVIRDRVQLVRAGEPARRDRSLQEQTVHGAGDLEFGARVVGRRTGVVGDELLPLELGAVGDVVPRQHGRPCLYLTVAVANLVVDHALDAGRKDPAVAFGAALVVPHRRLDLGLLQSEDEGVAADGEGLDDPHAVGVRAQRVADGAHVDVPARVHERGQEVVGRSVGQLVAGVRSGWHAGNHLVDPPLVEERLVDQVAEPDTVLVDGEIQSGTRAGRRHVVHQGAADLREGDRRVEYDVAGRLGVVAATTRGDLDPILDELVGSLVAGIPRVLAVLEVHVDEVVDELGIERSVALLYRRRRRLAVERGRVDRRPGERERRDVVVVRRVAVRQGDRVLHVPRRTVQLVTGVALADRQGRRTVQRRARGPDATRHRVELDLVLRADRAREHLRRVRSRHDRGVGVRRRATLGGHRVDVLAPLVVQVGVEGVLVDLDLLPLRVALVAVADLDLVVVRRRLRTADVGVGGVVAPRTAPVDLQVDAVARDGERLARSTRVAVVGAADDLLRPRLHVLDLPGAAIGRDGPGVAGPLDRQDAVGGERRLGTRNGRGRGGRSDRRCRENGNESQSRRQRERRQPSHDTSRLLTIQSQGTSLLSVAICHLDV